MFKSILSAAALAVFFTIPATQTVAAVAKPPATFQGQWWTHPLGCEYSRAGRPGETMWFLIVNTRKKGCPAYIAGKTWGNIYREEGSKM
ncbi:hypothetical protein [uncultured Tateyamaria sp.]|uniref:hypothetical protein n=1 Tax=uncultured Tateyamaria sp. TaxID=455651 RepID=UPI0026074EA0|nr:hypothetical protein [uncultured Tateyamaria sp.]